MDELCFQVNDMLPLVAEGLKAVQKAEEFIDASIGEECQFECRRGKVPASKPGHRPSSNGNSALVMTVDNIINTSPLN